MEIFKQCNGLLSELIWALNIWTKYIVHIVRFTIGQVNPTHDEACVSAGQRSQWCGSGPGI